MRTLSLPDGSTAYLIEDPSGVESVLIGSTTGPAVLGEYESPFPVYVPHTKILPDIAASTPSNARWVNVAASNNAYWAAMAMWWKNGEMFMVLEHDVVCRPDIIAEFDACPEPWCAFGYANMCHPECMEAWRNLLGCTRFRAEIIAAVPDAVTSVDPKYYDWHNMCDGVGNNLRAAGFTHHWHYPPAEHTQRVQRGDQ
jgi:hypothetical protein